MFLLRRLGPVCRGRYHEGTRLQSVWFQLDASGRCRKGPGQTLRESPLSLSHLRRWSVFFIALLAAATVFSACSSDDPTRPVNTTLVSKTIPRPRPHLAYPEPVHDDPPTIQFRDISATAAIDFRHQSGMHPDRPFPSNFGSGLAAFDYDGDGLYDLFFGSNRDLGPVRSGSSNGCRLYRNLGNLTFRDVTESSGVGFRGFNHGAAVGDADGDGFPDLFLTNLGPNVLYLNNGDGTFRDATAGSGLDAPPWSTGAAFLDYNGDGHLDLYVTAYGVWEPAHQPFCGDATRNIRVFCSPYSIAPVRHYLFRNRGDGTFEDTTAAAGILRTDGRGLGVIAADLNGDALTDLYVANDGCPNFLFLNKGDGTFRDATESSGAATNEAGEVQGSMGVDAEDVNGDGQPELLVTNFRGQYTTLYRNHADASFQDVSAWAGLISASLSWVGWGCALADFDNDGLPDVLAVNGEVDDNLKALGQDVPFAEPSIVWRNVGGVRFRKVAKPGPFFAQRHVARGASFFDLDDDGRLDLAVNRFDGPPAILRNESAPRSWIRLDLIGRKANRSAIGARVSVIAGDRVFQRLVKGGGSYLSANDPRILVGLGDRKRVDRVEIQWPGGEFSQLDTPTVNQTHLVREPAEARR